MNDRSSKGPLSLLLAIGLGMALPAVAQDQGVEAAPAAPAEPAAAAAEPAAPAAAAAPTGRTIAASDDIGEVIVTARRVEERAQDVPISMTIFSQEQLTQKNVTSGVDLATYTPSLTTNSEFGTDNTSFAIRGFRQAIGTTASVAVYFNDVVAPRGGSTINAGDGGGPGSFFDLQNVQVLKGPQGTLFGRNTDGGAILLVPQKPTSDVGGFVEESYGSYDMKRIQGVFNTPLADNFRVRFGVDHEGRDGFLKNVSGIGPSYVGDINYTALRASAVWDIAPNLENYTVASYTNSHHDGSLQKIFACDSSGAGLLGEMACAQMQREKDSGHGFYTVSNDLASMETKMKQWQVINTTTWAQSDDLTVKNIVSYAELSNTVNNDLFGTNFYLPATVAGAPIRPSDIGRPFIFAQSTTAPGFKINDESTLTEELRFQGSGLDNRLVWQSGLYAEFNDPIGRNGSAAGSTIACTNAQQLECVDALGAAFGEEGAIGTVNYQVGTQTFRDYGIYEQATYSLTDDLKFTEGFRYTIDHTSTDYEVANRNFPSENDPVMYCQDVNNAHNLIAGGTPAEDADGNADPSLCHERLKQHSHAPTWTTGLDYKLTPDTLLYGKYSRGYRQGSVNPVAAQGGQVYEPEKVDTYEIGSKTSFDSFVRGIFNVSLFYNDFTDQQLTTGFISTTGKAQQNQGIVNAGKSRIYGLEVETTLLLARGLTFNASYAYLNSKLQSIKDIVPPANSPYDVATKTADEGGPLPLTPQNKVTGQLAYVLPVDASLGRMTLAAGYTYQSSMIQTSKEATPYYKTAGYGLANANFDWLAIAGSQFDAGFFGTNLLDKHYAVFIAGLYSGLGFEAEQVGDPRTVGVRVRYNFGK
jgi:iron complex outermembrane receptor protein